MDYRDGERHTYSGRIPKHDLFGSLEAGVAMARLTRMARSVPLEAPWTAARALEWDSQTFQTWMDEHLYTDGARHLLQLAIEAVFSVQPRDVSLLHVLFYIHSGGNLDNLVNTTGGAQAYQDVTRLWVLAERKSAHGLRVHIARDYGGTYQTETFTEADINPYIAMATCLGAGLWGIEHDLDPGAPVAGDAGTGTERLPGSLKEATALLEQSSAARAIFGEDFVDHYVMTRKWEVFEFERAVTDWESRRYFEMV